LALWSAVLLGMRSRVIASSGACGISPLPMWSRLLPSSVLKGLDLKELDLKELDLKELELWYARCREPRPILLRSRQILDPPGMT
jgi:hypothetical protein